MKGTEQKYYNAEMVMWNSSILFLSSSNLVKVTADHIGGTLKLWDSCLKLGQGWLLEVAHWSYQWIMGSYANTT